MSEQRTVEIEYFAILREQRGQAQETLSTAALTARELYGELQARYSFSLAAQHVRVAINEKLAAWETELSEGDRVVFLPPVAGG